MSKLIRFSLDCLLNFGLENLIYVAIQQATVALNDDKVVQIKLRVN